MYNQRVLGKTELQTTTVIFSRGNIGDVGDEALSKVSLTRDGLSVGWPDK